MKVTPILSLCFFLFFTISLSLINSRYAFCETIECDESTASEITRIYFVNGMQNDETDRLINRNKLRSVVGVHSNRSFGISVNTSSEWFFPDLFQTMSQKGVEPSKVWTWLNNHSIAPQWFKDDYADRVISGADFSYSTDLDLQEMVKQYLRDLNSGKKVVLVSHSQGNFYANNAYQYIHYNYQKYRNSIGIVAVGTPATRVQDGGPYTTNSEDSVINLLRFISNVLSPTGTYQTNDPSGHSFSETYLEHPTSKVRIRNQIFSVINSLTPPPVDDQCDPSVPVIVKKTGASNIKISTATLWGHVQKGEDVDGMCIWRARPEGLPDSCVARKNNMSSSGSLQKGYDFKCIAKNLIPDTIYDYRVCGRKGDYVYDSGITSFKTKAAEHTCDESISESGGTEGLSINYYMGNTAGWVRVVFNAFNIPDKMEIWQNGNRRLHTPGYVSGENTGDIYYDPDNGTEFTVLVYGNSDSGTAWNINISCPN